MSKRMENLHLVGDSDPNEVSINSTCVPEFVIVVFGSAPDGVCR